MEHSPPVDTVVETAGLEFAALTRGDGDRLALCLHGFPDCPRSMVPLMDRLADAGYRVVAPYMRGYGETERPPVEPGNYSPLQLGSDVFALLDALDAEEPLVVGHDWGGLAVLTAAISGADRIGTAAVLSIPPDFWTQLDEYAAQSLRSWYMTEFQVPGHGEDLLRRDDFALIERLWRLWSPNWAYDDEHLAAVKATFRTGETVPAALQYYRDFFDMFLPRPRDQRAVAGIEAPTLLVAGRQDGCIGADMFADSLSCFEGRAALEVVPTAGHFVQAERPDAVADRILAFVDDPAIRSP